MIDINVNDLEEKIEQLLNEVDSLEEYCRNNLRLIEAHKKARKAVGALYGELFSIFAQTEG